MYSAPVIIVGKKNITTSFEFNSDTSELSITLPELTYPFSIAFAVSTTVPSLGFNFGLNFGLSLGKKKSKGEEPSEEAERSESKGDKKSRGVKVILW